MKTTSIQFLLVFLLTIITQSKTLKSQSISWTDAVGVSVSGNTITKTAASGWGTGGVASSEHLDYVTDGWVEVTVSTAGTSRMFGLSNSNTDAHYNTVDYAWLLSSNSESAIYQNGAKVFNGPGYGSGSVFRVERNGFKINYLKDGVILYTSFEFNTKPLVVDIAMNTSGSTLDLSVSNSFSSPQPSNTDPSDPSTIQLISWKDVSNVAFIDNKVVKTDIEGWGSSGLASNETLPNSVDGWIQSSVFEPNTTKMFGLSESNIDANNTTIDFAWQFSSGSEASVYEEGVKVFNGPIIGTDDIFRIERVGSNILYKRNGTILYTSTVSSVSQLVADLAFYSDGSSLEAVELSSTFSLPETGSTSYWSKDGNTTYTQDNVAIGRNSIINGYKLAVEGKIISQAVKITMDGWADHVFNQSYDLKSLKSLEEYINKNKHLPDIPSESEVLKNGIDLGVMNKLLLQKIEELTLYLIEQNKKIIELEKRIEEKSN